MIISTDKLNEIIHDDKNLLVVDTRSYAEYSKDHIPGAVNLDLFSFHWIDTSKEGISSFNVQMKKIFSMAGIDQKKKIVFYDNTSGILAARGVWLLMYFSHPDALMLDGGLQKWKQEHKPVEQKTNKFEPTEFLTTPNPNLLVGFEYLNHNLDRLKIIDARTAEEYNGLAVRAARGGHIPNSINIDWTENITSDGTIKDNSLLSKLYPFPKDTEIVTYCQGAYRAANSFLALKKLGFENVKVYLGSWGEWGNKLDLPVSSLS
jgi:thiosulfate/3-mercaptopyruvate sulfurtransferase